MRLLCLQQSSIFETYGGIEYYLHDFLTLSAELFGSSSILSIVPNRTETFSASETNYEIVPVPFKQRGIFKKFENRLSPSFFSTALKKSRSFKPDLILIGHVSLAPMGLALSKILGIPYWTLAYGLEVWGGLGLADEWALRSSQKIISISRWTKNILVARGFSDKTIEIVHPCLQPMFEQKSPKIFSEKEEGPLNLLTVSRLDASEQYKGHDHVLAAMNLIKQQRPDACPRYTIQGHGTDRSRLEQLVFYSGLQNHVTFLDKLERRDELDELYRSCDVFIMPSRFGCWEGRWRGEGFGIVYVEAGAMGIPSIAYNCGGATDIIQSGSNGILVTPDDITELSRVILELHDHRDRISEMGRKAREAALTQFSRNTIQSEIKRAFESCQSVPEIRPSSDSIDVSDVADPIS